MRLLLRHDIQPGKAPVRFALQNDVRKSGGRSALLHRLPALNGPGPDVAQAQILTMAEQTAEHKYAHTPLPLSRPGALDSMRACRIPVYARSGDRDEQASPEFASIVADAAPIGRYALLAGLGHYALLEDPVPGLP